MGEPLSEWVNQIDIFKRQCLIDRIYFFWIYILTIRKLELETKSRSNHQFERIYTDEFIYAEVISFLQEYLFGVVKMIEELYNFNVQLIKIYRANQQYRMFNACFNIQKISKKFHWKF